MELGAIAINEDTNQRLRILQIGSGVSELIKLNRSGPSFRHREVQMLGAIKRSLLHMALSGG